MINLKKTYNVLSQEYKKNVSFSIPLSFLSQYSFKIPRKTLLIIALFIPAIILNIQGQQTTGSGSWDDFQMWWNTVKDKGLGGAVNGMVSSVMGMQDCDEATKILTSSLMPGDIMSLFPMTVSIIEGLVTVDNFQHNAQGNLVSAMNIKQGVFSFLLSIIKVFAVIACVWRIVEHYLKTEDHGSVAAYFGYFKFIPLCILFALSTPLANTLYSKQQGVVNVSFQQMSGKIKNALKNNEAVLKQTILDEIQSNCSEASNEDGVATGSEISSWGRMMVKINFKLTIWELDARASISSFLSLIIVGAFSVASVMMTVMTFLFFKVLMAGVGIVFLLGFIPQFKNAWVSYLSNFMNLLLWAPIFNAILLGFFAIVSGAISPSLSIGNLIYLTLLVTAMASQIIPLTQSAASLIISGAGSGASSAAGALNGTNLQDIAGRMLK
ncbi:hypothetical protein [Chryseobacterium sp. 18068]|uniref:hypothetical protein n=1 Tax=Chryseobacterium sp. 18068 TaxID=2681414 RepID=UPI0013570895|nr:hypothetical protein [Chryseobacterium sp. 18068]